MTYEMPKLPYANDGLEPVISQATIDYHWKKLSPLLPMEVSLTMPDKY